jgi:hypothetical protein
MIYDIFYVSKQQVDADSWQQFRQRFPSAQKIENVKTIDDVKKRSFTKFFWLVWDDLIVSEDFVFDYRVEKWDEEYIHVFLNAVFRDGICLFPKSASVIQKEFDHRYYINKKELDIVASNPKPNDVVFISYNEPNADENYEKLKLKRPDAKRVHGVKGIHNAHIAAAKLARTAMFWVVDADAGILKKFNFEIPYIPHYNRNEKDIFLDTVHVWQSINPVNGLIYGYGGVKLLPRNLTLDVDTSTTDMTTSISKNFKLMPKISNSTMFNIDEFSTWRSAFRECVKLSSKTIDRLYDEETEERLMIWCALGINQPFGAYSIGGAKAGKRYGELNIAKKEMLLKINDFDWLEEQFLKWQKEYNEQR